jgi:dihydrofolate synthase/folylpolyglutamate synthase
VITSIGFDHMQILGNTLPLIAAEKAGIIKRNVPLVEGQLPGEAAAVMEQRTADLAARRFVCGREFTWTAEQPQPRGDRSQRFRVFTPNHQHELVIPLPGRHQMHNASLAVMACELVQQSGWPQITPSAISSGLWHTSWPLRFEISEGKPPIILDAAHNPDSIDAVCKVIGEGEWRELEGTLIFAVSADKDAEAMLRRALPEFRRIVITRFVGNPRSVPPESLLNTAIELCQTLHLSPQLHTAATPEDALDLALQLTPENGYVLASGSLFLAAEVRSLVRSDSRRFRRTIQG